MNWRKWTTDQKIASGIAILTLLIVWVAKSGSLLAPPEPPFRPSSKLYQPSSGPLSGPLPRPPLGPPSFCTGSDDEIVVAQVAVRQILKAPSTARFVYGSESWKRLDDECVIQGKVDAQNSFGAMIRGHWVAVLGPDGSVRRSTILE